MTDEGTGAGDRKYRVARRRKVIRLQNYDYSRAGAYFVTICAQDRACLFGEVVDAGMRLNEVGQMVQAAWEAMPAFYPGVQTDAFVVMPNHVHGILVLVGAGPRACPAADASARTDPNLPRADAPPSLPDLLRRFKTMTTTRYSEGVKQCGWRPFRGRLWQRSYFEHVVRGPESLLRLRRYIAENPARWLLDAENPAAEVGKNILLPIV